MMHHFLSCVIFAIKKRQHFCRRVICSVPQIKRLRGVTVTVVVYDNNYGNDGERRSAVHGMTPSIKVLQV